MDDDGVDSVMVIPLPDLLPLLLLVVLIAEPGTLMKFPVSVL